MKRREIFNQIVRARPKEPGGSVAAFVQAVEDTFDAFTYSGISSEKLNMLGAFRRVISEGTGVLRETGAYSAPKNRRMGTDDDLIFQALDQEMKYQDAQTSEHLRALGRSFSLPEEIVTMRTICRDNVPDPRAKGWKMPDLARGVRQVTAIALRALENHTP
jgi:hypothetical protein